MTDTIRDLLAVGAVCATIVGATCYEDRGVSDLRTDISSLRDGLPRTIANEMASSILDPETALGSLRAELPRTIANEMASSILDPETALGNLSNRVDELNESVQNLEDGVRDVRRDVGSALRPTLDDFPRITRPAPRSSDGADTWLNDAVHLPSRERIISVNDAFSVDVWGWVSPVSAEGEPLPDGNCGIEPGGVLTVRRINRRERTGFVVEYTIEGETAGTSCDTGTYLFYPTVIADLF